MLGEFALRFTGSPDLYKDDYRRPIASVNFVTAHDGFTLNDLVSYNEKHNEANGEDNNDGESHNRSWNCGAEGPTDDVEINKLRERLKRNFLTTLFISQGVPMIVAGDEISRTQGGNNNAYCQDNEISWINWNKADTKLLAFTQKLIHLTKHHPVFNRRRWFKGQPIKGVGIEDIAWFMADGNEMTEENWNQDFAKSLGVFLNGKALRTVDAKGNHIVDETFYVIFNAHFEAFEFKMPSKRFGKNWIKILDTAEDMIEEESHLIKHESMIKVEGHSIVLLKQSHA
jgi:glycogen operon protein